MPRCLENRRKSIIKSYFKNQVEAESNLCLDLKSILYRLFLGELSPHQI